MQSKLRDLSRSRRASLSFRSVGLFILICEALLVSIGCGANSVAQSSPSTASVQVTVSPDTVTLSPSAQQRFTATVRGSSNTAVSWTASAGSITRDGTFTAPSASDGTQVTITATSATSPVLKASSFVTVQLVPIVITTSSLSPALVNTPYNASLSVSGGAPPYHWRVTGGTLAPGIELKSAGGRLTGSTSKEGKYSFTVKVIDTASNSATQSFTLPVSASSTTEGAFDGPAELPRVYMNTTLADTPAPGHATSVLASGDLQSALDNANCGDTIELQSGATFAAGKYTLPAKACDDQHWIIVRTSASDANLPGEGERITPCYAGVASLPGRPAFSCPSTKRVLATISYSGTGNGPLLFADGANHYRLIGLEITRAANDGKSVVALIAPTVEGGAMDKIVLDRLYVHGTPRDETRRGVRLSGGTNLAIQDSYISDLHCNQRGTCVDSQAVSGGTGDLPMGPYKIADNFLEAAGENILFGGDRATQTPADIEIRRNHLFKPLFWLKGQPGFKAPAFIVKNHFELKNAQRVLLDSNILENAWGGFSQTGFSILLTPKNQDISGEGVCPKCQVTDVTIRFNTISHVAGAFIIANVATPAGDVALAGQRYSIHDVIVDDIDGTTYEGPGTFAEVNTVAKPLLQNLEVNHVTAFPPHMLFNVGGPNTVKMPGFRFSNSIVSAGQDPVWSTGGGSTNCAYYDLPVTTVGRCFSGYVFSNNAILTSPYPASSWPDGNFFYSTAAIGFVNFKNGNGGDYQLLSSSPAVGKGSDGLDLGANVDAVLSAISGVE